MRNKLINDIEWFNQLHFARQDNIFHMRIILSKLIQKHRGHRQLISEVNNQNKSHILQFLKLQNQRHQIYLRVIQKYKNLEIDTNNKNMLFNFLSKTQRSVKHFFTKLQIIFNKLAQIISVQHNQFQNQLRQLSFQKISGQNRKVYDCLEALQHSIHNRFKKQTSKIMSFYNTYVNLIDKRAQKQQNYLIKQQKYLQLSKKYTISQSIQYNQYLLQRKKQQNYQDPYQILDLQQDTTFFSNCSIYNQYIKEEGVCQTIAIRMERIYKQLYAKNSFHDRYIHKFINEYKTKQNLKSNISKIKPKKSVNISRRVKSSSKNISNNSMSENMSSSNQQQRSVIRQTLMQMTLNERSGLNRLKMCELGATGFNFYKQKLTKTQFLSMFRKRLPIIMKQNI